MLHRSHDKILLSYLYFFEENVTLEFLELFLNKLYHLLEVGEKFVCGGLTVYFRPQSYKESRNHVEQSVHLIESFRIAFKDR